MKFDIGKFDAYNGTTFKVQLNAGSWFLKFKNANDSYDVLNNENFIICFLHMVHGYCLQGFY